MCGLSGVLGCVDKNDIDVMKDLLWITGLRGTDNTGVASVAYDNPEVNHLRITGGPYELLDRKSLDNVLKPDMAFIMGHNRSKTFGTVAPKDAHPFVFENIVGCHNGTLSWQSKAKMKDDLKFGTDSEALFWDIENNGFEDTIKRMEGAWALVWYDKRTKEINFHRNKDRPLCYVLDKQGGTLYWGSEPGFLYLALNRRGVEFQGKVKIIPENTWVRWKLNDKKGFTLDKPVHRNLVAPPFVHRHETYTSIHHGPGRVFENGKLRKNLNSHGHMGAADQSKINGHSCLPEMNPQDRVNNMIRLINGKPGVGVSESVFDDFDKGKISTSPEVIELYEKGKLDLDLLQKPSEKVPGYYLSPEGLHVFQSQFTSMVSEGCVVCSEVPVWGEPLKILRDNQILCVPCLYDRREMEDTVQLVKGLL